MPVCIPAIAYQGAEQAMVKQLTRYNSSAIVIVAVTSREERSVRM